MPVPLPDVQDLNASLPKLRIGWCAQGPFAPVTSEVEQTVARAASTLGELGCEVEPVALAEWDRLSAQSISMVVFFAEGGQFLAPIIAGREDQLAPSMQRRLALPSPTLDEYLEASANCEALRQDMASYFTKYDVLLCPVGPVTAHPHDARRLEIEGQTTPPRHVLQATLPFDLTGSPAMSVPFGWSSEGLPIGVQIVGRHFDETTVLRVGAALEALHSTDTRRPPV